MTINYESHQHNSSEHQHFLLLLRNEAIIFCFIGLACWTIFTLLLFRAQWKAQKRRRKEDMFVVLESENGDAHYMVSFFTQGNYAEPPTGVAELHLIGSLYPGKIHELVAHTAEETFHLFPPLCRDKFLVTEDVCLGRLIGIVLKTTVVGKHPTWNCESVIVRDIQTNEAWYFHVHREVAYPPRMFLPATHDELCTFKFSLRRRLRRELRNGQFAFFSFLFRSKVSVYTIFQRCMTALMCYTLLFVTSFFFLDCVWPPLVTETEVVKTRAEDGHETETELIKYRFLSQLSYWGKHILCPALISSLLTTICGFFIVSTFRQQSKYETNFEEMDYVIGTALHESDHMKELHMSRAAAESLKGSLAQIQSETDTENTEGRRESRVPRLSMQQEEKWTQVMLRHIRRINPFSRPSIYERDNLARRQTMISMLGDIPESEPPTPVNNSSTPAIRSMASAVSMAVPAHSVVQNPLVPPSEPHEPVSPARELTPLERRIEMRRLFMGRNIHDHFVNEIAAPKRKRQPFKPGVNNSLDYKSTKSKSGSTIDRSVFGIPGEGKHVVYGMSRNNVHAKDYAAIDAEHNPFDLGNFDAPVRKWYQPVYAWLTVILLFGIAGGLLAVIMVKGVFHAAATTHSVDLVVESVLSTFVAALLFVSFIAEPLKILVVALYFAWKDKSMYKRITDKTKRRRQAAEAMLHMNST